MCLFYAITRGTSTLNGVTGIFQWLNPSGRIVALGSTQPLNRNEYQESFLGVKDGRCVELTTLPHSCADFLEILEPQLPGTPRVCPRPVAGKLYLFTGTLIRYSYQKDKEKEALIRSKSKVLSETGLYWIENYFDRVFKVERVGEAKTI